MYTCTGSYRVKITTIMYDDLYSYMFSDSTVVVYQNAWASILTLAWFDFLKNVTVLSR